ncbi:DUF6868 family protein [Marinicella gelatinilytica]|uniref:DUF6868 family protein n=1 Tax=Marinicella gelatinilytica TaxID=2996017 RepID=UPI002260C3F2|nr:hypothetical protein [Marinicella gelatinilytica]MCX7545664.1 hypothetical protein [Marinicella gelatinilytica]
MMMFDWQAFLGWNVIVHFGLLMLATLMVAGATDWVIRIHQKMFDLPRERLLLSYWYFLAFYKVLIWALFLGPYVVIRWLM